MARRKMARNGAAGLDELGVGVAGQGLPIPSGSTLIDLACTDTLDGFCTTGHSVNIIGDRNSGKTALALASQAETFHRHGDTFDYDFYDGENAFTFNVPRLFGKSFAKALNVIPIPPEVDWCTEALADKIVNDMLKKRRIVVLDSMDVLRPRREFDTVKDVMEGKRGIDPRAVANNYFFRRVIPVLAKTGSFLIYLSQARDNIGFGAMFVQKTRSGGKALGYYAYVEMWLSAGPQILQDKVKVGHWVFAKIERSKGNGKKRTVQFPILPAYGIDDVRANVEWLIEEKVIKKTDGKYNLAALGVPADISTDDPYKYVEENNLICAVIKAVRDRWAENEKDLVDKTFNGRKSRYE